MKLTLQPFHTDEHLHKNTPLLEDCHNVKASDPSSPINTYELVTIGLDDWLLHVWLIMPHISISKNYKSVKTFEWKLLHNSIFTRGQFWPSGIVVACVCLCVCPCAFVNPQLVRAITHHPFKRGSPNLDHRCKRPWLRSLLFWGVIDLDLQGQI